MIGSREVQGVLLAIITVASLVSATIMVKGVHHDEYDSIGLLNSKCKIGTYPSSVVAGSSLDLCIYLENHRSTASYYLVVYKIADNRTLPSNDNPSPVKPLREWRIVLAPFQNTTLRVTIPIANTTTGPGAGKIALVFELWRYSSDNSSWVYTGRWVHLYVKLSRQVLPGK